MSRGMLPTPVPHAVGLRCTSLARWAPGGLHGHGPGLGEIAAQCEPRDAEQAEAHYRQALALAEELGMRPLVAHCHLGLGTLSAKLGRQELAHMALSAAIALYRAMDTTFWLTQAEAAMASLTGEAGDTPQPLLLSRVDEHPP